MYIVLTEGSSSFAGQFDGDDIDTVRAREIRELSNGMLAMQNLLSSIPPDLITELLSALQLHISRGRDTVLPAEEDVRSLPCSLRQALHISSALKFAKSTRLLKFLILYTHISKENHETYTWSI